jgi:hypothetical protein
MKKAVLRKLLEDRNKTVKEVKEKVVKKDKPEVKIVEIEKGE